MGTHEPNADYKSMKPYKLKEDELDLVGIIGGVTAEKAQELYLSKSAKPGLYEAPIPYFRRDGLSRTSESRYRKVDNVIYNGCP